MIECYLIDNDCYKAAKPIVPARIVVHSTGADNPYLKRYVQAAAGQENADAINAAIGRNVYGNHWNRGGLDVCVHAFIGKRADGNIDTVHTLPYDFRAWGAGSGSKGTFNDCAIQFEICEDGTEDKAYAEQCFEAAAQLCAGLIGLYPAIGVSGIVSHREAHGLGYASNHGDPDAWWKKHGLTMDRFRARVGGIVNGHRDEGTGDLPSKWAKDACEWAKKEGLLLGDGNGNYGFREPVTREMLFSVLYRLRGPH